jgi:hypothetical protein
MFLFRDTTAKPAGVTETVVVPHENSTSAKKSRKKKRSNKKKNKPSLVVEDSADVDSEGSSSDDEVDVEANQTEIPREENVGTGGSHVDVMIQSIAQKLKIDREEVKQCVDWMWDRGLKYDNEEEVEQELKKQVCRCIADDIQFLLHSQLADMLVIRHIPKLLQRL